MRVHMIAHHTEPPLSLDTTTIVSSLQPKELEDLISKANNTKKQNKIKSSLGSQNSNAYVIQTGGNPPQILFCRLNQLVKCQVKSHHHATILKTLEYCIVHC